MRYSILILLCICSLGFFSVTFAQTSKISQTTVNIDMVPENPKPNETVYVSLTSYATDINNATITWKINGKTQKTGVGEKSFSFPVGAMGIKTTLGITIKTVGGEIIEKTLAIRPSEVDLIWQSKSFVPPFYKGKALFSHQNEITFIAIPHITGSNGQEIGVKNLIYRWKKNGTVIEDASGYAKNSYTFTGSLISRALNISVDVYSPNNDGLGFGRISIEPIEPSIIMYKKDPTYGINFQKALIGSIKLDNSKEATLIGFPFFFGTENQASVELSYKWSINGVPIENDPGATTQIFRQKEGTSGSSKISLTIENADKILQYASTDFNLRFGVNDDK